MSSLGEVKGVSYLSKFRRRWQAHWPQALSALVSLVQVSGRFIGTLTCSKQSACLKRKHGWFRFFVELTWASSSASLGNIELVIGCALDIVTAQWVLNAKSYTWTFRQSSPVWSEDCGRRWGIWWSDLAVSETRPIILSVEILTILYDWPEFRISLNIRKSSSSTILEFALWLLLSGFLSICSYTCGLEKTCALRISA